MFLQFVSLIEMECLVSVFIYFQKMWKNLVLIMPKFSALRLEMCEDIQTINLTVPVY